MKPTAKRIGIVLLLCLLFAAGLLPLQTERAHAIERTTWVSTWDRLKSAMRTSGTVVLLKDITCPVDTSSASTIASDTNFLTVPSGVEIVRGNAEESPAGGERMRYAAR